MKKQFRHFLPLALLLGLATWGCVQTQNAQTAAGQATSAQQQEATTYAGKILGMSKKAKTISIEVGQGDKAKTMMVKFDDQTRGLDFAKKDEGAIITWEMRGSDKFATVIKPKLAKLPEGVSEVKTDELQKLIESKTDMVLLDSRPEKRYALSHLPGAVSLPVDEMEAKALEILPPNKDRLLLFYCGGPT